MRSFYLMLSVFLLGLSGCVVAEPGRGYVERPRPVFVERPVVVARPVIWVR